jgi:methionyl-tRNA formyltransferase
MNRVVILTGGELRHDFVRMRIASSHDLLVVASYCEGAEKSLGAIVEKQDDNFLRLNHLEARKQSEEDFFRLYVDSCRDESNPVTISKGEINDEQHVRDIIDLNPNLILAYGCSIIRSELLEKFEGRFINVHLGLSPYYRGSGTNFWPLVNGEPEFVGATFMYIDKGVDTGEIIHQMRSHVVFSDSPVNIGNRLIVQVADEYVKLVRSFPHIRKMSIESINK